MAEKQFYTAIDLGTTNSVIAYGNIVNDKFNPVVLDLERKNETGSTSRGSLLPSVVFYYKNKDGDMMTDVGDYAKGRYGINSGYVCKSVKSLMGVSDRVPLVDDIADKTPADVSAQILSYMIKLSKKRLFQPTLSDVIITVPASFDSDQCQATIDAARKAGINVENRHDVLLYEPKAVIYDFMRMQEAGEISADQLNLDTDKNILVFDLGGGTLDVTIHRVGRSQESLYNIKDLAICRYTLLGGDDFDRLIAQDMLKRFEEMYGITVSVKRHDEVMCKLIKLAENLKKELSTSYENAHMSDVELDDDYEFEVMDTNLYDIYAFESNYTKGEIEKIIAPLMGYRYKKEDAKRIQQMTEKDVDNIIYPILDVLDKAGSTVKIDAVLLNGGMTKFYLVKKRLKDFFGFEPLATSDPDLAVARGAVYYHYCLHKYNIHSADYQSETAASEVEKTVLSKPLFNTSTILNDSINLGLRGEYVSLLIPAGTELPYRSEEIRDKYKLEKTTNSIGIEMFLGRGKTKNLPNRRIATRVVKFRNTYPANTPISFQIYINSMRMMTMEAWITDKPNTKATIEMDMASLKETKKVDKGIQTNEKIKLNAKSEMNGLKDMAERNKKSSGHELNDQITSMLEAIGQASNPEDFFDPCIEQIKNCKQSDVMRGYVYTIAQAFKDGWNEQQKRQIWSIAKEHFKPDASMIGQNSYVMRKALELIAAIDPEFVDFYTEYLRRVPEKKSKLKKVMLQCVVLNEKDDIRVAKFFDEFFKTSELNKWIVQALVQRYGRGTSKEYQLKLSKLVKTLAKGMDVQNGTSISRHLVVLIAELCSDDIDNPLQNDKYTARPAWQALQGYLDEEADMVFCSAIVNIWNGTTLTAEEEAKVQAVLRGDFNDKE